MRRPPIVRGGPQVDAVLACAEELAEAGREDEAAVQQVRDAANGRNRLLKRALSFTRLGSGGDESLFELRGGERMDRLLVAAVTGDPIRSVSPEQELWFERLEAFSSGTPDEAYARVKTQVPSLDALEQEVRAHAAAGETGDAVDDDWWDTVYGRLERMVGWRSKVSDPMLRSGAAFEIVYNYLGNLVDIFDNLCDGGTESF